MVVLENVFKHYVTDHAPGEWVLHNVSLTIPAGARVAVIGNKGAGKSTLLRLIEGIDSPTKGQVGREGRVSSPARYNRVFQPLLTGRQNAKFICRINGCADEMEELLAHIERLAGLGGGFNKPVNQYNPAMKLRLSRALSLVFDCEIYISDGFDFLDDEVDAALKALAEHATLVMTAKGGRGLSTIRQYCTAGILLHEGSARWFDSLDDALKEYDAIRLAVRVKGVGRQKLPVVSEPVQPIVARIKAMQNSLGVLRAGLTGAAVGVKANKLPSIIRIAKDVGMELGSLQQISERGYQVKSGETPILMAEAEGEAIEYFDLQTQCDRI